MLAKSHMTLGLLGGIALYYLPFEITKNSLYEMLFLPIIIIGSVLPDIDEPRSFIGRKFPIISHLVSLSFTHRGFTHFLLFPLLIALLGLFILPKYEIIGLSLFALSFGVFMHQIGDMLTISGISYYLFPFSTKKAVLLPQFLRFRTGSRTEKFILIFIFIPLVALSGMDKFDITNSFDFDNLIKLIGELL